MYLALANANCVNFILKIDPQLIDNLKIASKFYQHFIDYISYTWEY